MGTKNKLQPGQRDELRFFFGMRWGSADDVLKAQSYDPRGDGGESHTDENMLRRVGYLNPFALSESRIRRALDRMGLTERGTSEVEILRLAYGPLAEHDIHGGNYPHEISALLRRTDRVQMVAGGRYYARTREAILNAFTADLERRGMVLPPETVEREVSRRGQLVTLLEERPRMFSMAGAALLLDFDGDLVVPAPPHGFARDENDVLREGDADVLFGDELVPGALDQAKAWLAGAEAAYAAASRAAKKDEGKVVQTEVELPRRHPVAMDPCLQRDRERKAQG